MKNAASEELQNMSIINCENLTVSYEGKTIIDNLSFGIDRGDYLCIVGENGSGKTTLMKTLLGLKKPDGGSVRFEDGCDVCGNKQKDCRKDHKIGYLPQQTDFQKDFPASVWEIVLSGTLNEKKFKPFYTRADKKQAADALERMGIGDLKKTSYMNLSGGQQQRVLLARAICATEDILFLDEPVAGLDPKVTADMYTLISQLNEDGITIVMISHDIESAIEYSNRILHLGKDIRFFGTTKEYRKTELCEHYLCHIPGHLHHSDACEICHENKQILEGGRGNTQQNVADENKAGKAEISCGCDHENSHIHESEHKHNHDHVHKDGAEHDHGIRHDVPSREGGKRRV